MECHNNIQAKHIQDKYLKGILHNNQEDIHKVEYQVESLSSILHKVVFQEEWYPDKDIHHKVYQGKVFLNNNQCLVMDILLKEYLDKDIHNSNLCLVKDILLKVCLDKVFLNNLCQVKDILLKEYLDKVIHNNSICPVKDILHKVYQDKDTLCQDKDTLLRE